MSKKQFRAQASSVRVASSSAFGTFGSPTSAFALQSSPLSYVYEAPDLTGVSDANIRVVFQRLMKKDSTTKTKALEELDSYITTNDSGLLENHILSAWVLLYPRLSIDLSRRVRLLSHTVTGNIAAKIGKRIAPHLPKVAPPWLAGTHDADRATSKAALDALANIFPRPQKYQNLLQTFSDSILQYCVDAITNETPDTLCDRRVVSADDAQATHARVVSTAIAVIAKDYMTQSGNIFSSKQRPLLDALISDKLVWSFSSNADVTIRKNIFSLVIACSLYCTELLEPYASLISTHLIDKALHSDQTGSAADLIHAILAVTRLNHAIWTSEYTGKKSALQRLNQCVKKGSQSSSAEFWSFLAHLAELLVKQNILPHDESTARDFLLSLHQGAVQQSERANALPAWNAYLKIYTLLQPGLDHSQNATRAESTLHPLIEQYLFPDHSTPSWTLSIPHPERFLARVCHHMPSGNFETLYSKLGSRLVEEMKVSLPEQSKDYHSSQAHVGAVGQRWARLTACIRATPQSQTNLDYNSMQKNGRDVITECVAILQARDAKPYGAAMILEEAVTAGAPEDLISTDSATCNVLQVYLTNQTSTFVLSPSRKALFSLIYRLPEPRFVQAWSAAVDALELASTRADTRDAVCTFLEPRTVIKATELAKTNAFIQGFLQSEAQALAASRKSNTFLATIFRSASEILSEHTADVILSSLLQSLDTSDESAPILSALKGFVSADNSVIKQWATTVQGSQLLPKLIHLEETAEDDSIANEASTLSTKLLQAVGKNEGVVKVIKQSLNGVATPGSTPVATLVEMLERSHEQNSEQNLEGLWPDEQSRAASLHAVMVRPPPALSITQSLGGLASLVTDGQERDGSTGPPVFDAQGYSQAVRISILAITVLRNKTMAAALGHELTLGLLWHLRHTLELLDDNLSIPGSNGAISKDLPHEAELLAYISDAKLATKAALEQYVLDGSESSPLAKVLEQCLDVVRGSTHLAFRSSAYYSARVAADIARSLEELRGTNAQSTQLAATHLSEAITAGNDLSIILILSSYQEVLWRSTPDDSLLKKLINELVASLTDADCIGHAKETGIALLKFNVATKEHTLASSMVANQRLVFMTKTLLTWLNEPNTSLEIKIETFQALRVLLPSIRDVYGEHWAQVLQSIQNAWLSSSAELDETQARGPGLALTHSTLRVLRVLHDLTIIDEPNDDLTDAWKEQIKSLVDGLAGLLVKHQSVADDANKPLEVTNELIGRSLGLLQGATPSDSAALYPLLGSPSRSIQQSAMTLLREHIRASHEQVTFDAALENKNAQLPAPLLSLVMHAPNNRDMSDDVPVQLQGYLFSWILVFEHFTGATSHKVKSDYIEELKGAGYLASLLDLIYEALGHTRGRPVDISSSTISSFEPSANVHGKQETQALLAHLLYLALLYAPSLTKTHYRTIKSRQTSLAVASWAAKHISPLIVSSALASVTEWAQTTVKTDPDYADFTVKVSPRSREVNASYLVDGQTMAIMVRLPEEYPLENATVDGPPVVVEEKRWNGWLRASQGLIIFNNGNLIDAISTWFRNVTGTLKGQTECAICYSIISADKQLPSKRCSTCKQLFHGSCLFKWFKSSNASTCPLCRNPFNYG